MIPNQVKLKDFFCYDTQRIQLNIQLQKNANLFRAG